MTRYPKPLTELIAHLKKLPGVGTKTAERFAFQLLDWKREELQEFAASTQSVKERIRPCPQCGCLLEEAPCLFCDLSRRDSKNLCIISSPKDVYLFEETGSYRGLYHVLGTLLSPLDGKRPEHLKIDRLIMRIQELDVKEVILALDSTIEGDATALYLKEALSPLPLRLSRLALGLPMGSTLDYIDGATLSLSLRGRQTY